MQSRAKWLLAAMMFLEYAVWGAWTPILGDTLTNRLHATGTEIGIVYGVLWLACIITPFIGGQLVDRYMPSQVFLGIASIICAGAAWMMGQSHQIGSVFSGDLLTWMWVWSLAFAPTLGITNSIVFHHVSKTWGKRGAAGARLLRDSHGGNRRVDHSRVAADGLADQSRTGQSAQDGMASF